MSRLPGNSYRARTYAAMEPKSIVKGTEKTSTMRVLVK